MKHRVYRRVLFSLFVAHRCYVLPVVGSRDDVLELRRYYQESRDPELIARCEARMKGEANVMQIKVNGGEVGAYDLLP